MYLPFEPVLPHLPHASSAGARDFSGTSTLFPPVPPSLLSFKTRTTVHITLSWPHTTRSKRLPHTTGSETSPPISKKQTTELSENRHRNLPSSSLPLKKTQMCSQELGCFVAATSGLSPSHASRKKTSKKHHAQQNEAHPSGSAARASTPHPRQNLILFVSLVSCRSGQQLSWRS